MSIRHRDIPDGELHNPKGFSSANFGDSFWKNEAGELEYTDQLVLPSALEFVDASVAPPTTNTGDIYVLSTGGSVHVDWGSVNLQDWVRYDGTIWNAITPFKGMLCTNEDTDTLSFFNGVSWEGVGKSIYTGSDTVPSGVEATITDTLSFLGGRIGIGATPDASSILDVTSTTKGSRPFPQVTTAQMNAISTPATNLVVYNTDLSSLMRYDGVSWVSMASGYGLVSVNDSSGVPTFYADLQDALETCKTSSGVFTVTLHSNITITSDISINYAGTGTGNGYLFDKLTIDFNGYKVTNAQANTSDCFDISLSNSVAVYQEIVFLNGTVIRTNGTGTHYALNMSSARYATVQMSKMKWYCENGYGGYINLLKSTDDQFSYTCDLGGSVFVSDSTSNALWLRGTIDFSNFHTLSNSSGIGLLLWANAFKFSAENTSTGDSVYVASTNNPFVSMFVAKSNSGKALRCAGGVDSYISNFLAKSVSGVAINGETGVISNISNFKAITGNSTCLVVSSYSIVTDGKCYNNSSSDTISATNFNSLENVKAYNAGSGYGIDVFINQTDKKGLLINCIAQSVGGQGGRLYSSNASTFVKAKKCTFISDLDTSSGHALEVVTSSSELWVEDCSMQVKNTGANGIYASSAQTIKAINNTIMGATTPINANVTVSASTDLGDGNRSY